MNKKENIIQFINENNALNLSQIENEAGIPAKTLHKAVSDHQTIPNKHLPALIEILKKYGFNENKHPKAQVISITNHKGGVGKTTTTINLGKALSLLNKRVLLIDMDSQGNLSQCFGIHQPQEQVIDALLSDIQLPVLELSENLYLVPSDIRMAYRETELASVIGADRRLHLKIEEVKHNFDFILIDCPPSLGICTTCSLVASDSVIVPIQPEASAYHGIESLFNRIAEVRNYINPKLTVKGIVFTMVSKNQNVHKEMMEHIKDQYKRFHIFKTVIDNSTVIKQSQVAKEDLYSYAQKSASWQQYADLSKEITQN